MRFIGREYRMCEEPEEVKESHVARVKGRGAWRTLNGPEGVEGTKSCRVCRPS